MIRSSLTLSISSRDAQNTSYLVNGTHLGLLSSIPQSTHVQTSGRPVQMIVALRDAEMASGSSLVRQKQQVSAWQDFLQILSRHEAGNLNLLMQKYRLFPEWMVSFDDHRIQAWIPGTNGFYLLRDQELRRMRPVSPRVEPGDADGHPDDPRVYYNLTISQHDQFFMLPPDLFDLFSPGEVTEMLLGLRQIPAKVGELIRTARLRGYSEDFTWLAVQIALLQADSRPGEDSRRGGHAAKRWFAGILGRDGDQSQADTASESDSLEPRTGEEQKTGGGICGFMTRLIGERWLTVVLSVALLILVLILALVLLLSKSPGASTPDTTESTGPLATVTRMPTPEPTPTARPTPEPTTTAAPGLVVSVRRLNLRSQPNRDSELILTLDQGDLLYQLEADNEGWVMVKTMTGQEGYVFFDYVSTSENSN